MMNEAKKRDVLIAGAGIGGVAAAIAMAQAGHNVKIFEQAAELGEIGAGMHFTPNATRVLGALGVLEDCISIGVVPEEIQMRMFDTDEVILGGPASQLEEHFGSPYLVIHRADIHNVLSAKLLEVAPDSVVLNARVEGYSEDNSGVTLHLADGREFTGDLLVGADGIKSAVRRCINGENEAHWTGDVAWRLVVPVSDLPAGLVEPNVLLYSGPGAHITVYPLRDGTLVNFCGLVRSDPAWRTEDTWIAQEPWEMLKADFAGWSDTIQALVDVADRDGCTRWALYDHCPISNWSSNRVTLLGDSAHATLPYLGNGAGMALEDAIVLTRALSQEGEIPEALQLYQRNRLERTAMIRNESAENGRKLHDATSAEEVRAGVLSAHGVDKGWLLSYDAMKVELV